MNIDEYIQIEDTKRNILYILFRHRKTITYSFSMVMLMVILYTFITPRLYESQAKLFVKVGRESVTLDPTATSGQTIQVSQDMENQINSEIELLKSRELAEEVIRKIGIDDYNKSLIDENSIYQKYITPKISYISMYIKKSFLKNNKNMKLDNELEKAAIQLTKNIEAKVARDSNIILLSFVCNNQKMAKVILQKIITTYQEKHIEVHKTQGSHEFFEKQKKDIGKKLLEAENRLRNYKNLFEIGSLPDKKKVLSEQLGILEQNIEEDESAMRATRAKIEIIEKQLMDVPDKIVTSEKTGVASSAVDEMQKKIYDLRLKEQELLSVYTEKSIPVQEVKRQITKAQAMLEESLGTKEVMIGKSEAHQTLEIALLESQSNLASLKARVSMMKQQILNANNRLQKLNNQEAQLIQMERERNILEQSYRRYSESLEQTRIDKALELNKISNISIAEAPQYPIKPVWPIAHLNLGLGILLALFGSMTLSFVTEYFDGKIYKSDQVEKMLALPMLGSVEKHDEYREI